MYRGQDIRSSRNLKRTCLDYIDRGQTSHLYSVLPHISLIRSAAFVRPLCHLLKTGDRDQQQFAAIALGAIGDSRCINPLSDTLRKPEALHGQGTQSLQTAVIYALGETGNRRAVRPLLEIFRIRVRRDPFSKRRRQRVICALGTLLQHGIESAQTELLTLTESPEPELRSQAATELGVAFWHNPRHLPAPVFERLREIADNDRTWARHGAVTALYNLAELGCRRALGYFDGRE